MANGLSLVAAEIVHDDDVARPQAGDEDLLDIKTEALAVDRAVDQPRGISGRRWRDRPPAGSFGDPIRCFQWVTEAIMNIADDLGSRERIGFVHEANDYQREAEDLLKW